MDIRSVVIGVDFSPAIRSAGRWVHDVIAPGASITLVHAFDPTPLPSFLKGVLSPEAEAQQSALAEGESLLAEWRRDNGLGEAEAQLIVRGGRPATVIDEVAQEMKAELIVIGPHGLTERPWQRVGSTAERLIRGAEASVLVLSGETPSDPLGVPRRLVVAVDDASITPAVLSTAGRLAERFDASIRAVHVLSSAAYSHMLSANAAEAKSPEEARAKVQSDLSEEALRWLSALWKHTTGRVHIDVEVPHGSPGDEILAVAERSNADLIVIGRYGAGRVLPAILGSVVGTVVQGARCPVLVVGASAAG
jgi:nucleotide-binding universal stress UspA family protein